MGNERYGSDFDEFLKDEQIFEKVESGALSKVLARQIAREILNCGITKKEVARRMGTSRSSLDRLLSGQSVVTLDTLSRAAAVVGKRLKVEFVEL